MDNYIYRTSEKYNALFEEIVESGGSKILPATKSYYPAVILFYCFAHDYGKEITELEPEAVEISLLNSGYNPTYVEKINNMIALVNQEDYVLSTADGFLYASAVLNDIEDIPKHFDSITVEQMLWAVIMLMAIFNAVNIPLSGDAVKAVAARHMAEGWTTPAIFFNSKKIFAYMPYANKEYIEAAKKHKNRFLYVNNPDAVVNIDHPIDNYFEMHKSILVYLEEQDKLYSKIIEKILHEHDQSLL